MAGRDKIFKQEINIKDPSYDVDAVGNYQLYIALGEVTLRVCVIDSLSNRCLILEDYRFYTKTKTDELIASLNRIYDNSMFLKANFWKKISIISKPNPFTLIPAPLFDAQNPQQYIQYITETTENTVLIVSEQKQLSTFNLFLIETKINDWFHQTYPQRELSFYHPTTVFAEGIRSFIPIPKRPKGETQMHVLVRVSSLVITVWKDGKLEFCNVFSYRSAQDFTYFVLFVMDELRLDKETCKVRLHGKIQAVSEIFRILYTYINDLLIWSEKPNWVTFSHEFDEIHPHYYFDLFAAYLC